MMNDNSEQKTKSELKRQMLALQAMGEILVTLSDNQLAKIPLEDNLLDAILHARSLKSHEAKRRQLQYIGKLMRHIDPEPLQTALDKILDQNQQGKAQFHQIERWREKLIVEGDTALASLSEQFPDIDHQYIRQLIRKSKQDRKDNKNSGAETELFRYLRKITDDE